MKQTHIELYLCLTSVYSSLEHDECVEYFEICLFCIISKSGKLCHLSVNGKAIYTNVFHVL